mgnify:CR=1 FL=1
MFTNFGRSYIDVEFASILSNVMHSVEAGRDWLQISDHRERHVRMGHKMTMMDGTAPSAVQEDSSWSTADVKILKSTVRANRAN